MAFNFLNKIPPLNGVSVQDIFEIISSLFDGRMGLHELADLHSEKLDEVILKEEKNHGEYIGGTFTIALINEAYMELSYEMFFKGTTDQYIKKEAKSKPIKTSYLDDEALKIIHEQPEKKISFEIDAPSKKA